MLYLPVLGMQSILDYYSGNISQTDLNTTLGSLASKGYQYYKDVEKYTKTQSFLPTA